MITDHETIDAHCEVEFFEADNLLVKRYILSKGDKIAKHIHSCSHLSILGYGSIRVTTSEGSFVHDAADCIVIKANTEHVITALEDSCWFCINTEKGA